MRTPLFGGRGWGWAAAQEWGRSGRASVGSTTTTPTRGEGGWLAGVKTAIG